MFGDGVCQLFIQQFFNLFASLKQQQNLMKMMFSCIHFPVWPYPPEIMKKKEVFYTGELYGLAGMTLNIVGVESPLPFLQAAQFSYMLYILGVTTPPLF